MSSNNNVDVKITASIHLYAMADTITYNNGKYVFFGRDRSYVELGAINELLYDFIYRGGINGIEVSHLRTSINTILNIATIKGLLDISTEDDKKIRIDKFVDCYTGVLDYIGETDNIEEHHELYYLNQKRGIQSYLAMVLTNIADSGIQSVMEKYDPHGNDNSAAIRTIPIGLAYRNNLDKLIEISLECSMITNTSPSGYLAGVTSSLFAAYAVNGVDIKEWPDMMVQVMKSQRIIDTITKENEEQYDTYMMFWNKYMNLKFNNNNIIESKSSKNLMYRYKFYFDNFIDNAIQHPYPDSVGSSGYGAIIMAYDCLLDSGGKWEKLIIYSGLHLGQITAVASISAGLFGSYYGWGDISMKTMKHLEFRDILGELSRDMVKKFR